MPDPPGIVKVVITATGKVVQGRAQVQVEVDADGKVARIPTIVQVEVINAEGIVLGTGVLIASAGRF